MTLNIHKAHASNIENHINDKAKQLKSTQYKSAQIRYMQYITDLKKAISTNDYKAQISAINDYLVYAKNLEINGVFERKSKHYSSILEELPVLLSEDYVSQLYATLTKSRKLNMSLGGQHCVIRITANPDITPFHETKNIDFCLAVEQAVGIWIPLVGLEVKKYVDKTMFGTILETYKSLNIFRPMTIYGFLVEDEARAKDVIRNSMTYKTEYILSGMSRKRDDVINPIDESIYTRFVLELRKHIESGFFSLTIS